MSPSITCFTLKYRDADLSVAGHEPLASESLISTSSETHAPLLLDRHTHRHR